MSSDHPKEIGGEGSSLNLSRASRALNITPDVERVKKHDPFPAEARREKIKHLLWLLAFAAPTAWLVAKGHPWWAILPGVLAAWNLLMFFLMSNASPKAVYEQGLLIPAVIVSESPLQIVALAAMNQSADAAVRWGVKRFTVSDLPGHARRVGGRVPCAAMFGDPMPMAGVWGNFDAHPACWATGDQSLLERAERAIEETEWQTLAALAQKAADREDANLDEKCAYYDENLSPIDDLYADDDDGENGAEAEES